MEQVCDIVNSKLGLSARDEIDSWTLIYWLKKGIIQSMSNTNKRTTHKYTPEQVENILEVAFVRIKLGVEIAKVPSTLEYLKSKQFTFDYGQEETLTR